MKSNLPRKEPVSQLCSATLSNKTYVKNENHWAKSTDCLLFPPSRLLLLLSNSSTNCNARLVMIGSYPLTATVLNPRFQRFRRLACSCNERVAISGRTLMFGFTRASHIGPLGMPSAPRTEDMMLISIVEISFGPVKHFSLWSCTW